MTSVEERELSSLQNYEKSVYGASVILGVWAVLAIWQLSQASTEFSKLSSGKTTFRKWFDLETSFRNTYSLGWMFLILLTISLAAWSFQLHKHVEAASTSSRSWSRGWTIGGWIIPIGFLFIPYLVIRESQQLITGKQKSWGLTAVWWTISWTALVLWRWTNSLNSINVDQEQFYLLRVLVLGAVLITAAATTYMVHETSIAASDLAVADHEDERKDSNSSSSIEADSTHPLAPISEIAQKIRVIVELRAEGLLTQDEFEAKKKEIIQQI